MSAFENRPERWLPKGPVPENDAEPDVQFSQLKLDLDSVDPEMGQFEFKPIAGRSDGSTASYYQLPAGATELQDLISFRNMNAQVGEMFRALYRYGLSSHSDKLRDAKKVLFYAKAEIERLEKYES